MSRVFATPYPVSPAAVVTVAASASINNLAAFTYAAWIYPTDTPDVASGNDFAVISTKDFNTTEISLAYSSQGLFVPGLGTSTLMGVGFNNVGGVAVSVAPDNAIQLNIWQRVAMTFDYNGDKTFHLYINGVETAYQKNQALVGAAFVDSGGDLTLGNDISEFDAFLGNIAVFELWNTALTPAQMAADYAGTSVLPGNLVDSLTFLTDQGSTEPDASGNGNVGVIGIATFSSSNPPAPGPTAYSVPDCRHYATFPNHSRNVNGTLIYDVPSVDSRAAGAPVDSRAAGAPVASGTYPQNSRTPGTIGPGE